MQLGVIFSKHLFDSQQNQRQFVEAYQSIKDIYIYIYIYRQIDRQIDIAPQLTQHMKSFGYFGCYKIQWCSLPMPLQSIVTPEVPFKLLIIMNFTKDEANQDQLLYLLDSLFSRFCLADLYCFPSSTCKHLYQYTSLKTLS